MDIDERYNEKYQVGAVKMSCDEIPTEIDDTFVKRNGFGLIVGSAGSGKTNLLIWLLTHRRNEGLNGKFDRVYYYISPSMDTIDRQLGINPERVYTEFNQIVMNEILAIEAEHTAEAKEEDEPLPQKLIIFDDMIVKLSKAKHLQVLMRLVYNRRHLGFYIIITGQKYNMLPKKLRVSLANKGFLILFRTQNKKELEDIHSEIVDLNKNEWEQILEYVFPEEERFNFLYVRFDKPLSQQFHKNFNRLKLTFHK